MKRWNIDFELVHVEDEILNPEKMKGRWDLILDRVVSRNKALIAIKFFETFGVKTVNSFSVIENCDNKFFTSILLKRHGVPTLKFAITFSQEQTKRAIEEIFGGYPVVIKPLQGSWGRLLSKINDEDALETILEHKEFLGIQHKIFYIQEYVEKPGRDIRVFVLDGVPICAIYRYSSHWITNTARGAKVENCPISEEMRKICKMASDAVGGGILAMDIFETRDGLKVNEINSATEFRNSEKPTGVSISEKIVEYCLNKIKCQN